MREAYAALLNEFPLVIPAAIFCAAFYVLMPLVGEYAAVIALVLAAKLTEAW